MSGCAVTVLVPVYDEAGLVETAVAGLSGELRRLSLAHEILVLNDGSDDWSEDLERKLMSLGNVKVTSHYPNRGKGAILNDVFPSLETELVVTVDADNEYSPSDLDAIIGPMARGEADLVMGSRYGYGRPRPPQRFLPYCANRLIGLWFNALSGSRIPDLLTGLYGFRRNLVKNVCLLEKRFAYTPELIWQLLRQKPRVLHVPVAYRARSYSQGKKIMWWETFEILYAAWKYRK